RAPIIHPPLLDLASYRILYVTQTNRRVPLRRGGAHARAPARAYGRGVRLRRIRDHDLPEQFARGLIPVGRLGVGESEDAVHDWLQLMRVHKGVQITRHGGGADEYPPQTRALDHER